MAVERLMRDNFSDFLNPAIYQIFNLSLKQQKPVYKELFTIVPSKRSQEIVSNYAGFGLPTVKLEGAEVDNQVIYQGYDYTIVHKTWGLGYIITFEMIQDDLTGNMKRLPRDLAISQEKGRDNECAAIFNSAFDTAIVYGDGKALCVSDHLNPSGGAAQSNIITPAKLSPTSLESMLSTMAVMQEPVGGYLDLIAQILLFHPSKEFEVARILQSVLEAGTAENDINAIKSLYNLKPVKWSRLSNQYYCWLIAKERESLQFFNRYSPDLKDDEYLKSRDVEYNSLTRFGIGVGDWRWVIGNAATS